jgi:hypothetical protein
LKKAAVSGISARKIIVSACCVNIWLYVSALMKLFSGTMSCVRMNSASTPPTRK